MSNLKKRYVICHGLPLKIKCIFTLSFLKNYLIFTIKKISQTFLLFQKKRKNFSEFGARKILTLLVSTFVVDF